ncbi:MAG: hypothetical protein ACC645_08920, partial [Pirellulales bacterium]
MCRNRLAAFGTVVSLSALVSLGVAAEQGPLIYAPDVLGVNRLFMIALRVPAGGPKVELAVPDSIERVDRTPAGAETDIRKFYFRTVKPGKQVVIRFNLPNDEIVVPIDIWSYEDLRRQRTLKGVLLPRRWPLGKPLPELKQGQTITTDAVKKALEGSKSGAQYVTLSDDQIWDLQPDSTIPRWHWTSITKGCPVHGTEIYKKRSYYPWTFDDSIPRRWKIECPIGGEEYPSND